MENGECYAGSNNYPLSIIHYSLFFSIFAPEIKDIQRFNAVSYTHLDVYKRQFQLHRSYCNTGSDLKHPRSEHMSAY